MSANAHPAPSQHNARKPPSISATTREANKRPNWRRHTMRKLNSTSGSMSRGAMTIASASSATPCPTTQSRYEQPQNPCS